TQDALFARKVGTVKVVFYAHRSYLQRRGEPRSLEELADHSLIGFDRMLSVPTATLGLGMEVTSDLFALRTDSELTQLAYLRAGFGIGGCQRQIAARDPNLGPILQ